MILIFDLDGTLIDSAPDIRAAVNRMLAGEGHEAAVAEAGRLWALSQTGRADEARALRPVVNAALKTLPAAAFPATAHAALACFDHPEPVKRLRLLWAVLRGRV